MLIFFLSSRAFSQSIVVSEYYNLRNDPTGEWAELIVLHDNVDLRGYILRDNSGSSPPPINWRGGIRFRNIPYWQRVHSGTIIVINFRGDAIIDSVKSDGYIELGAENDLFFEKVCYYCPQGWSINALNIAEASDIVQLLDSNGNNVYSLAHMPSEGGDFINITGAKLSATSSMTNGTSVSVVPGQNLNDFTGGFDITNAKTSISNMVTKGLPNNSSDRTNLNQTFWKYLRMPKWQNPTITNHRVEKDYVYLFWNDFDARSSPCLFGGYLVVRFLAKDSNNIQLPVDGIIYNIGNQLGSSIVLASTNANNYLDRYEIQCGEEYIYRVYSYKYNADDLGFDSNPLNRRGRIYNIDNYAEIKLKKDTIEAVNIRLSGGSNILCKGDTVKLMIQGNFNEKYKYDWLRNGEIYKSGVHQIEISEAGDYRLRITSDQGCEYLTNEIGIITKEKPKAEISVNGIKIFKDTIISVCRDENIELSAYGGSSYNWYINNALLNTSNFQRLTIDKDGEYYCIVSDEFCSNRTHKVRIVYKNIDFAVDKKLININFKSGISYRDTLIRLINRSSEVLLLGRQNFILPSGVEIISPIKDTIIKGGASVDVIIRCVVDFYSIAHKNIKIQADCGKEEHIELILERDKEALIAASSFYDFGNYLHCEFEQFDTAIKLYNYGFYPITIENINIAPPFAIKPINFPFIIQSQDSLSIQCYVAESKAGKYLKEMQVQYYIGNDYSNLHTLAISLASEIKNVDFEILNDTLRLSVPECMNSIEGFVILKNIGDSEIIISRQCDNRDFKFVNIPLIISAGSEQALLIKYEPRDIRHFAIDSLLIKAEQCEIEKKIYLTTQRYYYDYVWEQDNYYKANLSICDRPIDFSFTNRLILNGNYNEQASIGNIIFKSTEGALPYLNIKKGNLLKDTNDFIITFHSERAANYKGKILCEILPCYDTLSLEYDITVNYARLELEKTDIEFNECKVNDLVKKSVRIINNSTSAIFIDSIKIDNDAFKILNNTPLLITSEGTEEIKFTFSPHSSGEFNSKAILYQSEPCKQIYELNLSGKATIQSDSNKVIVTIPKIKARVGELIKLPMRITAIPPFDLSQANIVAIELMLRFNPKLFNLTNALPGSVFMQQSPFITRLYHYTGEVTLMIDQINPNILHNGEYVVIVGEALIGDSLSTEVALDTIIFYADQPIKYDKIDGEITIIGDCALPQRLVNVGGELKFELTTKNESEIEINFSIVSNEESKIKIYGINGILLDLIKLDNERIGEHTIKYDFSRYPSGIYYLVYQNGSLVKRNLFIHIK